MINNLAEEIHQNAKKKGFFNGQKNIGEMLCLIHSEVSEALESDRKDKKANLEDYFESIKGNTAYDGEYAFKKYFTHFIKDTFEDELADIMIRVMDLAAFKGVDLETHIMLKMKYNSMREYKHGKKY